MTDFDYEYRGKLGKTFRVAREFKTIPDSRWRPGHSGLLIPKLYLNISYSKPHTGKDGKLRVCMMREDPEDSTFWFDVVLPIGYGNMLETKTDLKRWTNADVGRFVHFEVKAYGVSTCYLNASSYVSYALIR